MASLIGNHTIQFVGPGKVRKTIRLGKLKLKKKDVATIKGYVEALNSAAISGTTWDHATAEWVKKLAPVLYDKLSIVGLVPVRVEGKERGKLTLAAFLDSYIAGRTDVKPNTRAHLQRARGSLVECFGANKLLATITPADADRFRLWLLERMGDNTTRRICGRAKQFFRAAHRGKLIADNPFADMKGTGVRSNREREYFVDRDVADAVIEACPNAEWRLIFALSRYGGLRCPSEHLRLRWSDIDWERGRMNVRSPKTEHHEGKESRIVPIFPELRPYLDAAWDEAEPGAVYCVTRYRDSNANLRTQLLRIIEKAKVKPWPKLFQNLRSTRQTELAETFPIHVVCEWIGNSQAVAKEHYLQVTEEHLVRAQTIVAKALHKALQQPSTIGSNLSSPKKRPFEIPEENEGLRNMTLDKVPPLGLEPRTY